MKIILDKTMTNPILYHSVQKLIAGPLHKRIAELIKSEIPDKQGVDVLDVGCGLGDYSLLFTNASYIGFDLEPGYIDHAIRNFTKPNILFLIGDAITPPEFSKKFDFIFSVGLYHHLSDEDTINSLTKLHALLAPGGQLLIFDAVYPKSFNPIGYLLRSIDRGKYVRTFVEYSKLLKENFKPEYINYHTAGVLDFVAYKLSK